MLLLEDYAPLRLTLRVCLIDLGYACNDAETADEALKLLELEDHDVVLIDLVTPHQTPQVVFEKCGREGIPFIAITGMSSDLARKYCPPNTPILVKPFDLDALLRVIDDVISSQKLSRVKHEVTL